MRTFSLLLLLSLSSYADTDGADCMEQAKSYGNGRGADSISFACSELYLKLARPQAVKRSEDGTTIVFGYRNMVFIRGTSDSAKQNVIAGVYTDLIDVIAVDLDEKNREVVVLERNGEVKFYSSLITGNVAPYRVIRTRELPGATDVVLNVPKDEVLVLHSGKVLTYSRLANARGVPGKENLGIKKVVPGSFSSISVDERNQELVGVNGTHLQVIKLSSGESRAYSLEAPAIKAEVDPQTQRVRIQLPDKEISVSVDQ